MKTEASTQRAQKQKPWEYFDPFENKEWRVSL